MGNIEASELQATSGTGVPGENLRVVLLRMIHEVSRQMVEDAALAVEQRSRSWMQDAIGSVEERIRRLEEASHLIDARVENRLKKIEDRLHKMESCQSCTGPSNKRKNLEERVQILELSVDSSLQSVLPRVEMLINQLNEQPGPKMMDFSPSNPAPAHHPPTNLFPTPPPDLLNPGERNLEEALKAACQEGRIEDVHNLINIGANMEARDAYGLSPIHWAVRRRHPDVLRLLIQRGADVQAKSNFGWTALHVAAKTNCTMSLCNLLNAGADVTSRDSNGWTPLHWAATEDSDASIRLLLAAGASTDVRDNFGMLPLDLAGNDATRMLLRR